MRSTKFQNYLYQINNGSLVSSQIFTGLSAGIYSVSVLDANNCLDTISVNITQPNQIILSENLNNHQDVTCFSGSDGGFEVLTSGGSPNYLYQLDGLPPDNKTGDRYYITTFLAYMEDTMKYQNCLLYTSPSPRDRRRSRIPSSA